MKEEIGNFLYGVCNWDWSAIIQNLTGIATVAIAIFALTSWRGQHRSQAVTRLLDQLTDAVHEFVQTISPAIQQLTFIRISIDSQTYNRDLNKKLAYPEAIAFIENEGRESADRLWALLQNAQQSVHRIRSLLVKGQVLGIPDYNSCRNDCTMIAWQFDRLQVVCSMISSQHMNWEHPKLVENLGHMLDITPEDISQHLDKHQRGYLEFVKRTYEREFKRT